VVVVSHSLGTIIAYDVLSDPRFATRAVPLLVTLGAPLGYTEIQDVIAHPLRIPAPVALWANFADPLDIIALDTRLADDFGGEPKIVNTRVDNRHPTTMTPVGISVLLRRARGWPLPCRPPSARLDRSRRFRVEGRSWRSFHGQVAGGVTTQQPVSAGRAYLRS